MSVEEKRRSWEVFTTGKKCERCGEKGVSTVVFMHKPPERICKKCFKKAKNSKEDILDVLPSI